MHLSGTNQLAFIKGTGFTPNYNAYWQHALHRLGGHTLPHLDLALQHRLAGRRIRATRPITTSTTRGRPMAGSPGSAATALDYVLPINERGENGNTNSIAEKILSIPEGSSLMNQSGMCLDRSGQPVLANWWAPGAGTNNHRRQYMVGFPGANGWELRQISFRTIDSPANKVPESALGDMGRPTIVCDKEDRLIVIYRDNEGAQWTHRGAQPAPRGRPAAAHLDAVRSDHRHHGRL